MVEVVELGRGQEGEVVSTVGNAGADESQAVPHGGGGQVGAQDHRTSHHRQHVGELQDRGEKIQKCHLFKVKNVKSHTDTLKVHKVQLTFRTWRGGKLNINRLLQDLRILPPDNLTT